MYSEDVADENYLRGVQETDADGSVQFTTIFPACYAGRWPHMHFEVYESLDSATSVHQQAAHLPARDPRGRLPTRSTRRRRLRAQRRQPRPASASTPTASSATATRSSWRRSPARSTRATPSRLNVPGLSGADDWSGAVRPARRRAGAGRRPPAGRGAGRRGRAAVRGLRARAVLHGALRLLRLQHLHRRRARDGDRRAGRLADDVRRARRSQEVRLRPAGARRPRRAGRRRSSSAAARRRCCSPADLGVGAGRDRRRVRAGAGRRGHHRGQPGQRHARPTWRRCARPGFNRISFGMQSAVDHVLTRPGPHPRPGAGAGRGRRGRGRPASSRSAST